MRNRTGVLLLIAANTLLCLNSPLLAQTGQVARIDVADVSSQAQFPTILQAGSRRWDNTYLIAIAAPPYMSPDKPGITLYDRDGNVARQATVWLDGATDVIVEDAAISPSGNFVVSGGAVNKDGAVATFVAQIGSDGQIQRLVRTTPFTPAYVCALDDGTLWAYGFDRDAHDNLVEKSPRLRQYSFDKGQLRAVLDPSTLPDAETSGSWHLHGGRYLGEVSLRCNSNEVALYNGQTGDLVEFDLRKNSMQLTKLTAVPGPPDFHITGFALTQSGDIFASFHDRSNTKPNGISGLFRLSRVDSGGARWVAVSGTVGIYLKDSPIQKLWGADGDKLVFSRLKDGRLYWSK